MSTSVSLYGQIVGEIVNEGKSAVSFRIQNETGVFQVKAPRPLIPPDLGQGSSVHVGGTLRTYVNRRCRSSHVYLEAGHICMTSSPDPNVHLLTILANAEGEGK